jgi:starch synthase
MLYDAEDMKDAVHVALIAAECFPFSKVGGLGDVVGSLPHEFETLGARVEVVIPDPGDLGPKLGTSEEIEAVRFRLPSGEHDAEVRALRLRDSDTRFFFVGGHGYFPRGHLYVDPATGRDYPDQLERWIYFQRAALALLARECPEVDILHCHEHQAALVPFFLEAFHRPRGAFGRTATVFTIHNLGYQGLFPADQWPLTGLEAGEFRPGGSLEFFGRINLMKGGIIASDALTVVSPTYAKEIQTEEYGCGLESVISQRRDDLVGITNGIDTTVWNPRKDPHIAATFTPEDPSSKSFNRRGLLERFDLEGGNDWPVLAVISRIDYQKGLELLVEILDDLLDEDLYFVLLGTGDKSIERSIERIVELRRDHAAACFRFDDGLAHQIMAGADMLLIPSRYEPCGLTQMYALQYGTVPVVRATGGLADTVEEFDAQTGEGTGFRFARYDAGAFRRAIDRARSHWPDKALWRRLMRNGMTQDFSWKDSARRYLEVFESTLAEKVRGN